jgi:hypothetical protein
MFTYQALLLSACALCITDNLHATPQLDEDDVVTTPLKRATSKRSEPSSSDDEDDREKGAPALKRANSSAAEPRSSSSCSPLKDKYDQKQAAIERFKQAQANVAAGRMTWDELTRLAKTLRMQFRLTNQDLGIEHKVPLKADQVEQFPLDVRLQAMIRVLPDFRHQVPLKVRQEIMQFELTREDPLDKSKLEAILGLKLHEFTPSQEEARDVELPRIDGRLAPIKRKGAEISKQQTPLEEEKRRLEEKKQTLDEGEDPSKINARLAMIEKELAALNRREEENNQDRGKLNQTAKPFINKLMRDFNKRN